MLALKGQRPDEAILERMVSVMTHRGPDDSGWTTVGPCGLGHTSLVVMEHDKEIHQPLMVAHTPSRTHIPQATKAWITHDGEIYNFNEIYAMLKATRHHFTSYTDTEVALRAYLQFGSPNFINAFRGKYAFAIWDESRETLILARDRLGHKPLYYVITNEWLVFASEIKALLLHPDIPCQLNESVVPHYLAHGYPPAPDTLFNGIQSLPPGHVMSVNLRTSAVELEAYWQPPYPASGPDSRTEENIAIDLLAHLRWAIRLRMKTDRSFGVFLSGGLDSAALVALMAEESRQAIKTFSLGFARYPAFDETKYARKIAARYVTEHYNFVIDPNIIAVIEELMTYRDQPFGNASAVANFLIGREARGLVTTAITGDGGDELFAGYDRFRAVRLARTYNRLPDIAQRAIGEALGRLPEIGGQDNFMKRASRFVQDADLPLPERYLGWVRYVSSPWLAALTNEDTELRVREHYRSLFPPLEEENADAVLAQLLDVNLRTYLPGDMLNKLDSCAMASGLEIRSPFLDHVLLRYAAEIPTGLKLKRGTSKYILKRALRGLLPNAIIDRKRQGFWVPLDAWFRDELSVYARNVLLGDRMARRGLFDMEALKAMLDIHMSGQADLGYALWPLLTFELWLQRHFD